MERIKNKKKISSLYQKNENKKKKKIEIASIVHFYFISQVRSKDNFVTYKDKDIKSSTESTSIVSKRTLSLISKQIYLHYKK